MSVEVRNGLALGLMALSVMLPLGFFLKIPLLAGVGSAIAFSPLPIPFRSDDKGYENYSVGHILDITYQDGSTTTGTFTELTYGKHIPFRFKVMMANSFFLGPQSKQEFKDNIAHRYLCDDQLVSDASEFTHTYYSKRNGGVVDTNSYVCPE